MRKGVNVLKCKCVSAFAEATADKGSCEITGFGQKDQMGTRFWWYEDDGCRIRAGRSELGHREEGQGEAVIFIMIIKIIITFIIITKVTITNMAITNTVVTKIMITKITNFQPSLNFSHRCSDLSKKDLNLSGGPILKLQGRPSKGWENSSPTAERNNPFPFRSGLSLV